MTDKYHYIPEGTKIYVKGDGGRANQEVITRRRINLKNKLPKPECGYYRLEINGFSVFVDPRHVRLHDNQKRLFDEP